MGILGRLLGREGAPLYDEPKPSAEEVAVEGYRHLLRTAPPETIEHVHLQAFSQLSREQRDLLFHQLGADSPQSERPSNSGPACLAHAATRHELLKSGSMERILGEAGKRGGGPNTSGTFATSLRGSVIGFVLGSTVASAYLSDAAGGAEEDDLPTSA